MTRQTLIAIEIAAVLRAPPHHGALARLVLDGDEGWLAVEVVTAPDGTVPPILRPLGSLLGVYCDDGDIPAAVARLLRRHAVSLTERDTATAQFRARAPDAVVDAPCPGFRTSVTHISSLSWNENAATKVEQGADGDEISVTKSPQLGRPRLHEDGAARARAWRAQHRPDQPGTPGRPRIHTDAKARKAAWRAGRKGAQPPSGSDDAD